MNLDSFETGYWTSEDMEEFASEEERCFTCQLATACNCDEGLSY
jgi:hypothetical protein